MQIRLIGSPDQIQRLAKILPGNHQPRSSRKNSNQSLLYLDVDDRTIENLLNHLERTGAVTLKQLED